MKLISFSWIKLKKPCDHYSIGLFYKKKGNFDFARKAVAAIRETSNSAMGIN